VRREDVYRILPSLEKMGLIERFLGKPTEIRLLAFRFLSFTSGRRKNRSRTVDRYEEQGPEVIPQDWRQQPLGEESIYILIAEKKRFWPRLQN